MLAAGKIDYLDMSLWDYSKAPVDEAFSAPHPDRLVHRPAARRDPPGRRRQADERRPTPPDAWSTAPTSSCSAAPRSCTTTSRRSVAADPDFHPISLPVTRAYLRDEGLGPAIVEYMNSWKGFVAQEEPAEATA